MACVRHPGNSDPSHHDNLPVRPAQGHDFTADRLWQSKEPPALMEQAEVHWMPMTSFCFFAIREQHSGAA